MQAKPEAATLKTLTEQLRWAGSCIESAQRTRHQLIVQAHSTGLSVRQIAAATGLSPTRVHQLLNAKTEPQSSSLHSSAAQSFQGLKKISLFAGLDDATLTTLSQSVVFRTFPKQAILIHEGDESDSLYMILSGRLQVYTSNSEGKEVLLSTLTAGDCFGELSLLDGQPRSASVRTLTPCQALILSRVAFTNCLYQHPNVALELLRALATIVRQDNSRTRGLALMGVYERLVDTLQQMGEERDGTIVIDNITHQNLAKRVYASREMVTLILKDLKQGGYISVGQRQITINKRLPAKW